MKLPRIKFLWSEAEKGGKFQGMDFMRALWVTTDSGVRLFIGIDGRVFVRACLGLMLVAWLGGVFGLSLWLDRNPYNRITSVDLLLPWRWSELRDLRGQMHLAQGRDDLKAGRYADGVFRIKAGLRQHPDDAVARLELGTLYARAGQWEPVKEIMLPGFEGAVPPRTYIRFFFGQAALFEDYETIIATSAQLLARPGIPPTDRRWLSEQRMAALLYLRRFEELLTATAEPEMIGSWQAQDMRIAALCRLGRASEAVAYIESLSWPAIRAGARQQLLAGCYRELGRIDEMMGVLNQLVEANAREAEPWLFAVVLAWTADRPEEARRYLDGYLLRFEIDDEQLRLAAVRVAALPAPALVEVCLASARDRSRPLEELQWQLVLAQLRSGDFAGFARTGGQLIANSKQALPLNEWIAALQEALRSDGLGTEDRLIRWYREGRRTMQMYRDTLLALEKAGRWSAMEAVASLGVAAYPASRELEERHALAAGKKTEQAALVAKAEPVAPPATATGAARPGSSVSVATRTPPSPAASVTTAAPITPVPTPSAPIFRNAPQLWSELDAHAAEGAWTQADDAIRSVRRAAPAWLRDTAATELDWREVRVAFELNDPARVRRLIRHRLDRDKLDANRAIEFAREFRARGNLPAARSLAEDILARVPDSGPTRRFLGELIAPPATTTP